MATTADLAAASAAGLPQGWGLRKYDQAGRSTCIVFYMPSGKRLGSTAEVARELGGWLPNALKGDRGVIEAMWAAIAANKSEEEVAADAGFPAGWRASATRNSVGKATYFFKDPDGKRVRSLREVEQILGRSVIAPDSKRPMKWTADELDAAEAHGLPAGWGLRKYSRCYVFLSPSGKRLSSAADLEKELGWIPDRLKKGGGGESITEAICAACEAGKSEEETAAAAGFPEGWKASFSRGLSGKAFYNYVSPEGIKVHSLRAVEDMIGQPLTEARSFRATEDNIGRPSTTACGSKPPEVGTESVQDGTGGVKRKGSELDDAMTIKPPDVGTEPVQDGTGGVKRKGNELDDAMTIKPPEVGTEPVQDGTGGVKRKGSELDDAMTIDGEEQHEGYRLRSCPNQQDACDIFADDVESIDLEVIGAQIEASGWKRMLCLEGHHKFSGAVPLSLHECGKLVVFSRQRQLVHRIGRQLADTWLAVE